MRKYIVPFFFLLVFTLTGCKKNDNSNPTGPDPTASVDIAASAFLQTATGGDPRATYAPNNPMIQFFANPNLPATFQTQVQSQSGSGTITLSGSSASSGTYTTNNLSMFAIGTISATYNGQTFSAPLAFSSGILKNTGTWSVLSQGKIVLDGQDTLGYAVNDKGMFIIAPVTEPDTATGQVINYGNVVIAFKK